MYTIRINFQQPGKEPVLLENIEAGQSILEICLKHNIALHHNCGGVCTCSSCHVYVHSGTHHLEEMSKREKDFLKRALHPGIESRLGCQCLLTGKTGELHITIPDQTFVPDE
jgi:2Fe-2S ferredoxin